MKFHCSSPCGSSYLFLLQLFSLSLLVTRATSKSVKRQIDFDLFSELHTPEEPFLEPDADLSKLNVSHLLEIDFLNRSLHHYRVKAQQVHSNVQERVQGLLNGLSSQVTPFQPVFSAEFNEKLNETLTKLLHDLELSPQCLVSLNIIRLQLLSRKFWPLKFIDSMKLLPSGLLDGVLSSFGEFEECLQIESPDVKWDGIRGKYCLAKVHLPFLDANWNSMESDATRKEEPSSETTLSLEELKRTLMERAHLNYDEFNNKLRLLQMSNMFNGSYFRMGICYPATCSSAELQVAANKLLGPLEGFFKLEIENECSFIGQEVTLDIYQKVALLILGFLSAVVGLCTAYDYILQNRHKPENSPFVKSLSKASPYQPYILTFSAWSNTVSLFSAKSGSSSRLDVVGAIMLAFVVLEFVARSYVLPSFYGMMNVKRLQNGMPREFFTDRKFIFVRTAIFAACTYVMAYSAILAFNLSSKKKLVFKLTLKNYLKYALGRWLSYARRLIGPILLIYLLPLFGDGPMWHYFDQLYVESCKSNLWSSFLFISNYEDSMEKVCNAPSMLLSLMFYLSLASPLFLSIFFYKPVTTVILLLFFLLLGTLASVFPKLYFELPVVPQEISHVTSLSQAKQALIHYLYGTNQLIVPFIFGTTLGYLLKCRPNLNLGTRFVQYILWIGMLLLPFSASEWNESFKPLEGDFTQFNFLSWFTLCRIMWSAGFSWILFACATGRGFGILSDILSAPILRPLSKLAFGVCLNHITILAFRQLTKKTIVPLAHLEILTDNISDIVLAFILSYFFYILIERPFYHWIQIVLALDVGNKANISARDSLEDLEIEELHSKGVNNNNNNRQFPNGKEPSDCQTNL